MDRWGERAFYDDHDLASGWKRVFRLFFDGVILSGGNDTGDNLDLNEMFVASLFF